MKLCAVGVSSRRSYPTPLQLPLVPKDVSARSRLEPRRNIGPPESPKHWPPLPCEVVLEILMNSPFLPTPMLSSRDVAANRVKNASGCFLQFGSHGSGLPKCCTPYPTMSSVVPVGSLVSKFNGGSLPYTGIETDSSSTISATSCVSKPGRPPAQPEQNWGSQ